MHELPGQVMLQASLQLEQGQYAYLSRVVEIATGRRFAIRREGDELRLETTD